MAVQATTISCLAPVPTSKWALPSPARLRPWPLLCKAVPPFPWYLGSRLSFPVARKGPTLYPGLALPPPSLLGPPPATRPFGRLSLNSFLCCHRAFALLPPEHCEVLLLLVIDGTLPSSEEPALSPCHAPEPSALLLTAVLLPRVCGTIR